VSSEFVIKLAEDSINEISKSAMERPQRLHSGTQRFTAMVRLRHAQAEAGRYNIDQFDAMLSKCDPIDLERCRMLAVEGSRIPKPEGFVRQTVPNEMRAVAGRLGNTYLKSAYKLWADRRLMIVAYEDIIKYDHADLNFFL